MTTPRTDDELIARLLHDWQSERSEWHSAPMLEVVREYAEWREKALNALAGAGRRVLAELNRRVELSVGTAGSPDDVERFDGHRELDAALNPEQTEEVT